MDDEKVIRTLRTQAWSRAKGELNSILDTYWDGHGRDQKFQNMKNAIDEFVVEVESEGWQE